MMRVRSMKQVLKVLEIARKHRQLGKPTQKALQDAIRKVADYYGVTYQTIGDGCRRRLGLGTIDEFHILLDKWFGGDHGPLCSVLMRTSEAQNHRHILCFFADGNPEEAEELVDKPQPGSNGEITVQISERDNAKLEVLADIAGVSRIELAAKLLATSITEKIGKLKAVI